MLLKLHQFIILTLLILSWRKQSNAILKCQGRPTRIKSQTLMEALCLLCLNNFYLFAGSLIITLWDRDQSKWVLSGDDKTHITLNCLIFKLDFQSFSCIFLSASTVCFLVYSTVISSFICWSLLITVHIPNYIIIWCMLYKL